MKKFFILFLLTCFSITTASANAISDYFSNLMPGDGDTELSIDLRENHSADYSLLLVRELDGETTQNTFTQLSLFNTEKNSKGRNVLI